MQSNELIIILYKRLSCSKSTMILIFPSVYVSRILFSKNPLVRSVHYASRQPNQFLCFIVIFYCFYYNFFHGKRLPINNVHFDNYDSRVNRELSTRRHALSWFYSLFHCGKVGQLFSQAWIWKNDQNISCTVNSVYSYMTNYLCLFSYVWHWRHYKPVHLWSSTALKYRASTAGFS